MTALAFKFKIEGQKGYLGQLAAQTRAGRV